MYKNFVRQVFSLLLGFVVANCAFELIAYAQTTIYLPDAAYKVCWDQNSGTLAEVNAWKIRVTYNALAAQDALFTCKTGNPIACALNDAVPMNLQVGTLNVKLEAATVQPDGTLSSYSTLLNSSVIFGTPVPAPPANSGSNLRLVKLFEAVVNFFRAPFRAW